MAVGLLHTRSPRRVAPLVIGLLGLALAVLVLASGFSRIFNMRGQPAMALALFGDRANAYARLADALQTAGQLPAADAFARQALGYSLTKVEALRVAGLAAEARGDAAETYRIMALAGQWGWRDPPTQSWILEQALRAGDYGIATQRADALLRRRIGQEQLFPVFRLAVADPRWREALAAQFADKPSWRLTFFHEGGATAPAQFDAMDTLFRALKDGPAPVSRAEAGAYLGMLVAKGEHRRAHRLWTELFAGAGGRNPLDLRWPDAVARDYPLPFDWKLEEPTGVMLDVEQAAEGSPAMLHLVADRGSIGTLASRKILLPPGGYVLSGANFDRDSRLLRWTVTCDGSGGALLLDPIATPSSSKLAFTVPPGCSVQSIALAIRDLDGRSAVDLLLPAPRLRAISRN
jgi:tetratricopeptide (TPR) repeat protein